VACPAVQYFPTLSQMARFGGGDIEHKMCVLTSSTTVSETCLILRRIEQDMNKNIYVGVNVKYMLSSSDFNET
jgi:hypothetical protein